jgi:hypothetical protein
MNGNQSKMDDTSIDGNTRTGMSVPKKEKNRVSGSQQNRGTSRPQPSNRPLPTTSQPSSNRGRGSGKNRSNSSNKPDTTIKKEANLLIDENFPRLSTGSSVPPVENTQGNNKVAEDTKKKKYAEALLQNPAGIPTIVTTTQSSTAPTVDQCESATAITSLSGDGNTEVPAVTNLLDKFNLHK